METLQRTANRGSISTGPYEIDNSLKIEADNAEYLERATGGGNGSTTQHTISVWVKRTELTKTSFILGFANIGRLRFESDDKIEYQFRSGRKIETNRKFRDTSAWYHIVVVADSSLATSTDRMKLYINGVRETDLLTYIPQDQNQGSPAWGVYNTYNYRIGYSGNAGDNFNGYIADAYYINGQTLDPTDFGEFDEDSGIWKPKAFTGTFDSLDNYLDFSNSSNLGEDANGGTDLSLNNITSADQATDTPTNNFATMNVLDRTDENINTQEGGTKITTDGGSGWCTMMATMGITKGKWYWEAQRASSNGNNIFAGVADSQDNYIPYSAAAKYYLGNVANSTSVGWYFDNGQVYNGDATFAAPSADDKVMIALDWDNKAIYFGVNGTWGNSSNPESGASKTGASVYAFNNADWDNFAMPAFTVYQGNTLKINFGGYTCISISSGNSDEDGYGTFEYAPPSGYYAICTKNLAEYG